jgi:transcriptional regulator with XRE-family HTH domain
MGQTRWTDEDHAANAPALRRAFGIGGASVIAYARMMAIQKQARRNGVSGGSGAELASAGKPGRPATSRSDPLDSHMVGARVKALRESIGLSLRDLSERSGVSAPMLSQVERGETSPTLTIATRIAAGLELRLSQLLRLDEGGAVTIVRAGERQRGGNKRRGHSFEVMTSSPATRSLPQAPPARRTTRRCTSRAVARPRSWSEDRSYSCATDSATSSGRGTV